MEELTKVLRKPKRKKSPGPDELPTEFFKELNGGNRTSLLTLILVTEEILQVDIDVKIIQRIYSGVLKTRIHNTRIKKN